MYLVAWILFKFIFSFWSTCATRYKIFRRTNEILGAELKILGAQLQILGAPTPKGLRLRVAIWAYSSSIGTQRKQIKESGYFTQEISSDINYWSRFVEYPHYPIASVLFASPLKFCSQRFLIFSTCGYSWELSHRICRPARFWKRWTFLLSDKWNKAFFTKRSIL